MEIQYTLSTQDDDFDSEYEIWCSDNLVAHSSSLDGAMEDALVYIDHGFVEVVKVTRKVVAAFNPARQNI